LTENESITRNGAGPNETESPVKSPVGVPVLSAEINEHRGEYKSAGYMLDSWVCSCGWSSAAYFDGDAYAEAEWKKHAAERMKEAEPLPERETGVADIIKPWSAFINARPALLSLLYDIDMLPEQTVTWIGALRLSALCDVWRLGEVGELPASPYAKYRTPDDADEIEWSDVDMS